MHFLYYLPLIAYTALISYLSLSPVDDLPSVNLWDKAAHTLAYGGFAVLAAIAASHHRRFLQLLAVCFAYGILIELLQGASGFREASFLDHLANTLGLVLGYVFIRLIHRLKPLPCLQQTGNSQ